MSASDDLAKVGWALVRPLKRPMGMAYRALTGRVLPVHAHYFDLGAYGGTFDAPVDAVRPRLPSGFEPIESRPGWASVGVTAFDYRRVDWLAPYRELAVVVPARFQPFEGAAHEGQVVLQLPVTSEEARWTGVDFFGFPKTVAAIDINGEDGGRVCTLHQHGQHVLTLHVAPRATAEASLRYTSFTVRGRDVVESWFDLEGEMGEAEEAGGVTLELGYHAIADQLRALELRLDSGRAFYAPALHAQLSPPIELGRLPEALMRREPEAPGAPPPTAPTPTTH